MQPEEYEQLDDKELVGAEQPDPKNPQPKSKTDSSSTSDTPPGGFSSDAAASKRVDALAASAKAEAERVGQGLMDSGAHERPYGENPGGRAQGIFKGLIKRRSTYAVATVGGGLLALILGLAFSFLAPFKLSFMKENVDRVKMARLIYLMDQRSDRFLVTLIKAEVAGTRESDGKNRYFEAKGWYNSPHPFTQWYRDMRVDKFFEEMADKQGVRFARKSEKIGTDRLVRLESIDVNGQRIDFSDLKLDGGTTFDFERIVEDRFESNRAGRRAFNAAVKEQTKSWQIIKRYNMRKWGYERLGITKWRFFEGTREKADKAIRDRWTKMVSKPILTGRFGRCLFGKPENCPKTSNPNDDRNSFANDSIDPDLEKAAEESGDESRAEGDNKPTKPDGSKKAGKIAGKFATKAIPFVNFAANLETARQMDYLLGDEQGLVKLVAVMRAAEYASSYMTFGMMTDHLKEGKDVDGEEVNSVMKMTEGIENSDSYNEVAGPQTASIFSNKAYAQDSNSSSFDPVTDMMMVNSDGSNAAKISNFYQSTFGPVVGVVVDAYDGIPLVGDLIRFFMDKLDFVVGNLIKGGTWVFGKLTGVDVDAMFASLATKMMEYLGGAPICGGDEGGARIMNCVNGGGEVVASALSQNMGMGPISDVAAADLDNKAQMALYEEEQNRSPFQKLASLDNPNSLAAKLVMSTPTSYESVLHNGSSTIAAITPQGLSHIFSSLPSTIASMFSGAAHAQSQQKSLFGVKKYGMTEADLDKEPWGAQDKSDCDTEKEKFMNAMSKGEDPPTSICMVDDSVANSLSCMGSDNKECASVGLVDGGGETDESGSSADGDLQELAKKMLENTKITYWNTSTGNTQDVVKAMADGKKAFTTSSDPYAVENREVDLNPNILRFILDIAKEQPIMVNALTDKDHSGTSNHYKGIAVDLNCNPAITANVIDDTANKYNGHTNFERCDSGYNHWHIDFPKK